MNVHDFARRYLYPYKVKGDEIVPQLCPVCKGGSHHDKETFALNISKQTYNCKRGSCGAQGHFTQLCREFGEEADRENFEMYQPKRTYKKPETKINTVTNEAQKYLGLRKISKSTMDLLKVGCDEKGNIVFPYYENGELVMMKFRPAKKIGKGERKAWREEGGKPILWGMDLCTPDLPIIITEGEIDTLSCYEAGLKNVVSVPSGAEDFTWLELCWEWLKQFTTIILFGDNDEPGNEMVRKLILKLGDFKLLTVQNNHKDANELLFFEGSEAVKKAVEKAKEVPVHGLIDLADVIPLDVTKIPKVLSSIPHINKIIGGFMMGDVSIWTGKRGQGKSTITGQILIDAVDEGEKVCAYSGELRADRFQYWINLQAAGPKNIISYFDKQREKEIQYVDKVIMERIKEWYRGKFWLYDNSIIGKSEEESIIKIFTYAVKKYDCKVFLVDNLMTAKYNTDNDPNYYRAQSNFVGDLVEFANKYNVHVHLVAHPRKTNGELDNDDVSGTADITNRAANVFAMDRVKEEDKGKYKCDTVLKIMKNRWEGIIDKIGLNYCPVSKRLYVPSVGNTKVYGWENKHERLWWQDVVEKGETPF